MKKSELRQIIREEISKLVSTNERRRTNQRKYGIH